MCGSATFTIVASRTIMSWAAAMTTSARPSRRGTWVARSMVAASDSASFAATASGGEESSSVMG